MARGVLLGWTPAAKATRSTVWRDPTTILDSDVLIGGLCRPRRAAGGSLWDRPGSSIAYWTARLNNVVESEQRIRQAPFHSRSKGVADSFGPRSKPCSSPSIRSYWSFRATACRAS